MRTGIRRIWRSPLICWSFFTLFFALTVLLNIVDVKPYPSMNRDLVIGTLVFAGGSLVFFVLSCRATGRMRKDDSG